MKKSWKSDHSILYRGRPPRFALMSEAFKSFFFIQERTLSGRIFNILAISGGVRNGCVARVGNSSSGKQDKQKLSKAMASFGHAKRTLHLSCASTIVRLD